MPGWQDAASDHAIADVHDLIRVTQRRLEVSLGDRAWISPFSVAMALDGQLEWRSAPVPAGAGDREVARAAEALGVALVNRSAQLRACAILVSAGDENTIAVGRLEGTHREAPPFAVVLPWYRDAGGRVGWLSHSIMRGGWFAG